MNASPSRDVAVFTEAIQLATADWPAFLERACGNDVELRQRVEALLADYGQVGDFLEQPLRSPLTPIRPGNSAGEKPGDRIGRYKLLEQIGEGGCGVVYLAEQEEPIRRRVALKIIKPGMDTKSVMTRFEAERQALGLMDHPNIAKVFDAGATESGRPYFVMELVKGMKITDYCDRKSLTTDERLDLFVQVCRAVQHAHQKGVIHRDIKPSNILVKTTEDGAALPLVIDFGIAKATANQRLTDTTLFTAFEMLVGTPAYMSPEQADISSVDVDTRTDVYSLGVLLYELVTGSPPFDGGALMKAGLDEIRRVIRDKDPDRPSLRLMTMAAADLTATAERRQSAPPALIRSVRGDLDWIVMKALEKDRRRRYETANGLALDVQRFLANEPISARPPSNLYKLQKQVVRNKLLFSGIGVISLLLVAGLIAVSASLARERRSRHEAEAASVLSRQVTKFLEDMLNGVGPSFARGRDTIMLREILDQTAERVGKELNNQPPVEAELRSLIGRVYFEIGQYEQAEKAHRVALALNRKQFGLESKETASALNDLGLALWKVGNLAEAENAHQEALAIRRRLFGNQHPAVAASLNNLATVYRHQPKLPQAEALIREALDIRRQVFGDEHLEVADSLHNLSIVLADEGKTVEAEATARQLLAMRRRLLGNEHALVAAALIDVAYTLGFTGKLEEAESLEQEALTMQRKLLGDENPAVATTLTALGEHMRQRGDLTEADTVISAALSIQRKLLGNDSPAVKLSLASLGWTLEGEGRLVEAELAYREALGLWRKQAGNDDPHTVSEAESLVRVLIALKRFGDAEQLLDEILTPAFVKQASSAELLGHRAGLKARRGQWREAKEDIALSVEHQPANSSRFATLAALQVKTGDRAAYEQFRKKLLTTPVDVIDMYTADQVAKSCLFLPCSDVESKVIGRFADAAITSGIADKNAMPFFQDCKALSEYRQGHYGEAVQWAQKPLAVPGIFVHGHACAVLAMADWQLGRKDDARAMLAKGNALEPPVMPASIAQSPGNDWLAWLFARIQLDEAAALIQPDATTGDKTARPVPE